MTVAMGKNAVPGTIQYTPAKSAQISLVRGEELYIELISQPIIAPTKKPA